MSEFIFHSETTPKDAFLKAMAAGGVLLLLVTFMMLAAIHGKRSDMAELRGLVSQVEGRSTGSSQGLTVERLYQGETPQLAQVALQTDIQKLAERFEIGIDVIRTDTIEQAGNLIQLGLVFNGAIPEASLGPFLAALANEERLIVLDELSLRAARASRRNADQRRIAFQMKLFGYYR